MAVDAREFVHVSSTASLFLICLRRKFRPKICVGLALLNEEQASQEGGHASVHAPRLLGHSQSLWQFQPLVLSFSFLLGGGDRLRRQHCLQREQVIGHIIIADGRGSVPEFLAGLRGPRARRETHFSALRHRGCSGLQRSRLCMSEDCSQSRTRTRVVVAYRRQLLFYFTTPIPNLSAVLRLGTAQAPPHLQLPVDHWHATIGDPTHADAILDRLSTTLSARPQGKTCVKRAAMAKSAQVETAENDARNKLLLLTPGTNHRMKQGSDVGCAPPRRCGVSPTQNAASVITLRSVRFENSVRFHAHTHRAWRCKTSTSAVSALLRTVRDHVQKKCLGQRTGTPRTWLWRARLASAE